MHPDIPPCVLSCALQQDWAWAHRLLLLVHSTTMGQVSVFVSTDA
jgi:hypothetical protein